MTVTARSATLVGVLAVALIASPLRSWWCFMAALGVAAIAVLVDLLATASPGSIAVERTLPSAVTVGHEATVTWRVTNPHDRRVVLELADELWPSFQARTRRVDLHVPARSTATVTTTIRPERRGRFPVEALTIRVVGPLRLAARQRTRFVDGVVRVFPAFASREETARRLQRARLAEVGARSARGRGSGTEFDQLREYGPDDEFRRLDWAATARVGRPIVRSFRVERNQNVIALLDNGRTMAGTVGGVPRVEHGMDAVLALATAAEALDDRIGLVTFDRQVRTVVVPGRGSGQMSRLTEAMYQLEPSLADSSYGAVCSFAAHRFRRRSLLVLITDLTESSIEEGVLPTLPALVRRHLVVVAGVQDPHVAAWAESREAGPAAATTEAAAFRSAAAIAALERRVVATGRLRAAGALVLDAPPGRLAVGLVDLYLDLKATGRL